MSLYTSAPRRNLNGPDQPDHLGAHERMLKLLFAKTNHEVIIISAICVPLISFIIFDNYNEWEYDFIFYCFGMVTSMNFMFRIGNI